MARIQHKTFFWGVREIGRTAQKIIHAKKIVFSGQSVSIAQSQGFSILTTRDFYAKKTVSGVYSGDNWAAMNTFADGAMTGVGSSVVIASGAGIDAWNRELYTYQDTHTGTKYNQVRWMLPCYELAIPSQLLDLGFDVITAVKVRFDMSVFDSNFTFTSNSKFFVSIHRTTGSTYDNDQINNIRFNRSSMPQGTYGDMISLVSMKTAVTKNRVTIIPRLITPQMTEGAYLKQSSYNEGTITWYRWNLWKYLTPTDFIIRCEKSEILNADKGDTW